MASDQITDHSYKNPNDPVASQSPGTENFARRFGITIAHARRDRVVGEMKVGPEHLTTAGIVHSGALLGFADELAAHGGSLAVPPERTILTLETKANYFRRCRSGVLGGEAAPLHLGHTTMMWQTSIYEPGGRQVAVISHTQLVIDPEIAAAEEAAASPATNVPMAAPLSQRAKRPGANKATSSTTAAKRKQEEIAEAACEIIARKGFANASIREIAEAAGLHVPTLYQYVSSKDEVLELVYRWAMELLRTNVEEASRDCNTAQEKLLATVRAIIANGDRHRRLVGVLNRELKSLSEKGRLRVIGEYQEFLGRIADLISEGIQRGEFRAVPPDMVANFVEAICDVWPLRQFAVGKHGVGSFQAEAAAFIVASLAARQD